MSRVPPIHPGHPDSVPDPERAQLASEAFYPGTEPAEVAARLVKLVASQNGIAGARFWRVAGERPAVTHEVGQLPEANTLRAGQLLSGLQPAPASGKHLAWVLGNASHRLGILEAFGDAPLPPTTIDRVDELRRYAEAALDEPAARVQPAGNDDDSRGLPAPERDPRSRRCDSDHSRLWRFATPARSAQRCSCTIPNATRYGFWPATAAKKKKSACSAARGVAGWVARHGESVEPSRCVRGCAVRG